MSRLELPLVHRTLKTTGDDVVHGELILELWTNQSSWETARFRVDSGTEMTTMPAYEARILNLPIPRRAVPGITLRRLAVRPGLIGARIVGMDATEYVFPCYFLGDPNVPVPDSMNLLGLTGVINQIRLTFDGPTSPQTPHGILVVQKR
jgi:hypothetical protein